MASQLALIEVKQEQVLTVFTTEAGLDPYLKELEQKARKAVAGYDITTEAGRDGIRSVAYELARSKAPLKEMADGLTEEMKKQTKAINAERDRGVEFITNLQAEIRKDLTDFEEKEKTRVKEHQDRLQAISALLVFDPAKGDPTSADVQARINGLKQFDGVNWQEFVHQANLAINGAQATLSTQLAARQKQEADQAELEQLRAQKAAADLKAEQDRIANEAAEKARKDEREKAALAEAHRAAEARYDLEWAEAHAEKALRDEQARVAAAEAEKRAADEARKHAEERADQQRKAAHVRALDQLKALGTFAGADDIPTQEVINGRLSRLPDFEAMDWEEFKPDAVKAALSVNLGLALLMDQRKKYDAEKAAEAAAAQKKAQDDAAAKATAAEKKRQDDAKAAEDAAAAKREANKKHAAKINGDVATAINKAIGAFNTQPEGDPKNETSLGKWLTIALAKGEIPHTTIAY